MLPRTALATLAVIAVVGCGRVERTRECRSLVQTVNGGLDGIATAADARPPAAPAALADRYVALAEEVDSLAFQRDMLTKAQKDYASLLRDAAAALRALDQAQSKDDGPATARAKKMLEQVVRREKIIVVRLDAICHSP